MDGTQVRYGLPDLDRDDPALFRAGSRDTLIAAVLAAATAGAGVIALRGPPGIGKTMLMKDLARAFRAPGCCIVTIGTLSATPLELQRRVGDAAGLDRASSQDPDRLLRALRSEGGYESLVLLLDDADKVSIATFRYLGLLRDLCPFAAIRFQLVMLGTPGPWRGLAHPDLETLRREAVSQLFVPPLTDSEAASFLCHRLDGPQQKAMTQAAIRDVLDRAAGSPAEITRLTTMALDFQSRTGRRRVTRRAMRQFLPPEPADEREAGWRTGWALAGGAAVLAMVAAISVFMVRTTNHAENSQLAAAVAAPAVEAAGDPDNRQDAAALPAAPSTAPAPDIASSMPQSVLPQPPPSQIARGLTISPESASAIATAPAPNHAGGLGLVLVAGRGDTMPTLYARVYHGVAPPPYAVVVAANHLPIKEGSLVVFPTPPHGWTIRGPSD